MWSFLESFLILLMAMKALIIIYTEQRVMMEWSTEVSASSVATIYRCGLSFCILNVPIPKRYICIQGVENIETMST